MGEGGLVLSWSPEIEHVEYLSLGGLLVGGGWRFFPWEALRFPLRDGGRSLQSTVMGLCLHSILSGDENLVILSLGNDSSQPLVPYGSGRLPKPVLYPS